ncbi:hypothetical protein [Streptomyces sp. NPDC052042]|uniref:hypothetical protein n=1 Tax=Streptomyces sp. NPDC052042 TaxID=3365683 RepID=UPI0037D5F98A
MAPLLMRIRIPGPPGPGRAALTGPWAVCWTAACWSTLPRTAHAAASGAPAPGTGDFGATGAVDLIVPLAVLAGTVATALHARARRRRRAVTRTTPGTAGWPPERVHEESGHGPPADR